MSFFDLPLLNTPLVYSNFFLQYLFYSLRKIHWCLWNADSIRDRPFNLQGGCYGFLFRSEFFFRTTRELEFFFLSRRARNFFHNITLDYITKTLNQIFFPPPKSEYFFQQHWESEYFFRKKTITPSPGS